MTDGEKGEPQLARSSAGRLSRLRQRAPYLFYRGGSVVANVLPELAARGLAKVAGVASARSMRDRRLMIERHLRRVYGDGIDQTTLDHKVKQAFDSYARYWLESFRLVSKSAAEMDADMSFEGVSYVEEATAVGNGVIMALPHLGAWDFGGAWFASIGYPATVVVERLDPPELFDWFVRMRSDMGLTVVPHGPAAGNAILRALRAGEMVGLVCDRDLAGNGIEVDFFGERTTLPGGPATLALRTGAALLPSAIYYEGASHFGIVRPPIPVERQGKLRDDVARITQHLADELAVLIRRAPEQWHLFQPNWPSDHEALAALRAGSERSSTVT
ncbi:MAG: phosphatidylinositol mannoside acyltransferase [Acidimicrobiales bacterium]